MKDFKGQVQNLSNCDKTRISQPSLFSHVSQSRDFHSW